MSELTGRYLFDATWFGSLAVMVEEFDENTGYKWRRGKVRDLAALEPAVADGWRFVPERCGTLLQSGERQEIVPSIEPLAPRWRKPLEK